MFEHADCTCKSTFTGNGQLRDNDVTHVPADGYVEVRSDRHVQTNYDFNLSPADGYVEVTGNCLDYDVTNVPVDGYVRVLSDRLLQQNLNPAITENTDILINTQDPTTMYPAERYMMVEIHHICYRRVSQKLPNSLLICSIITTIFMLRK